MDNNNPGCLGIFLKLFGITPKAEKSEGNQEEVLHSLPYAKRDDFLSNAELSFYKVLQQYIGNKAIICPKVSLQDIFFVSTNDRSERSTYTNKINRKHVDFLLCSTESVKPICGIELDDQSHQRADRVKRDEFVDKVFETSDLHLIRFENKRSYTMTEIQNKLDAVIGNFIETSSTNSEQTYTDSYSESIPTCKKCGVPMVKRQAKKGDNKGKTFYGCSNFPKCKEVVRINE